MARTNKYASLNFNDIYDKKNNTSSKTTLNNTTTNQTSSSSLNKTKITNSRIHGNMLVLTRPTPKPISQAPAQIQSQTPPLQRPNTPPAVKPDPTRTDFNSSSDSISLRPLGSTGGSGSVSLPRDLSFVSIKPDKFVPPHLRPGYVCKEEKPVEPVKNREFTGGFRKFGEEGSRPKSGGGGGGGGGGVGYDRMRRGSTGPDFVFRPGSGGYNRPNSSG